MSESEREHYTGRELLQVTIAAGDRMVRFAANGITDAWVGFPADGTQPRAVAGFEDNGPLDDVLNLAQRWGLTLRASEGPRT